MTAVPQESLAKAEPVRAELVVPSHASVGVRGGLRLWLMLWTLLVAVLGGLEGWFGRTDAGDVYGSDAVQYLDCARALGRGDFHSALNPLWSQGYPALLALCRPLFAAGAWGDWLTTRFANMAIWLFAWAAFGFFLRTLLRSRLVALLDAGRQRLVVAAAICLFLTTQLTIGQVSRVGPDQLVAALFFLACALLLRLSVVPRWRESTLLGLVLAAGFLTKAVFLPLGCISLLLVAVGTGLQAERRASAVRLLPAFGLFVAAVLGYGAALSRAVGHTTLGEAGSLNYAWHVNRLAKWVHWEGGVDPAARAWPKAAIARFAQWDTNPPDFGSPVHPSTVVGAAPKIFVFHAPVSATYVPYFDPYYFYDGYRHIFRWRYQVIALGKNLIDLVQVLLPQPVFYVVLLLVAVSLSIGEVRREVLRRFGLGWPVACLASAGVLLFLPVHLEGRYFSGALAVLTVTALAICVSANLVCGRVLRTNVLLGLIVGATLLGLVSSQHETWSRALHGWSPRDNREWLAGEAVARQRLPSGAEVGMISWDPNLHCDWAYMAGVHITSEIATGPDDRAFWALDAPGRKVVLDEFRQAGAQAILTWDEPHGVTAGWQQLPGVSMWIYRL